MNLLNGEQVTVAQLLHAMLLASAADATLLAAQTVAGSVEDFVAMMNSRAAELGCADTHFTNTHGMHDENHYSTPADIYKITSAAMRQPLFKQIVALTRYEMPATNKNGARILVNTNYLLSINLGGELYYSFAQGIKTGFTTPAGPCLVSVAENRGERYTVVVMKSELKKSDGTLDRNGAFRITKQLYGWLFDTYTLKSLLTTATVVKSIPVNYGSGVDEVGLVPAEEFVSMLPKNMDMSGVVLNYSVGASADAPIAKGDVLGSAEILLSGQSIGNVTLVAADDIERNELSYTMAQIGKFFSSKAVVAVVIVLAALLVGYIVLNIVINRRKRRNSVSGRGKSNRKPKRRKKSGRIFD